ncbi:MAG TPA: DUF6603 domain-containing protein [Thermoanaerobaculia bacterium]|nr:DUF6603 domain-containing protein [Thermoanaerobaculia bacterium]
MADEATYLIRLAAWLARALGESAPLLTDLSTDHLGIDLPASILQNANVTSAAKQAALGATKIKDAGTRLETVAATKQELEILAAILELGAGLADFFVGLKALVDAVGPLVTPASIPDPVARGKANDFAAELAKRVADYSIASAITEFVPRVALILKVAGLLEWEAQPREAGNALSRAFVRKGLKLDGIKTLFSDPVTHFQQTIKWGDPAFDPMDFFMLVSDFFPEESSVEVGVDAGDPFFRACTLIKRDRTVNPPGLAITLFGDFTDDRNTRIEVSDAWGFGITSNLRLAGGITGTVSPPLQFQLKPLAGQITGDLRGFFDRNPTAQPFDIVGGTGLLSISANNVKAGVGLHADWDGTNAHIEPLVFANIDALTVKIGTADADSFIGSLLASLDIHGEFDLGLEWKASTGLHVTASGGIEIAIPLHTQLGPITIETIYIALKILSDGTLSLEVSTAIDGSLGPLSASVDRIGAKLNARFASGTDAKFGPFDLDLGFKPPNGIGLAIDAGVVKGGGYLYIDTDRGEYDGVLQLMIADIVTVTAIGLITTKNPDGSSGFSLLVIITAEFGTGIQLGFGFVLLGVGGLLGLNRTAKLQPLTDGVRSGAIDGIMFPHDVVANAARIISDLRNFFPPLQDTFLIGPMAKLGWGTPALVTASFGIIVEIPPGNVIILGVLRVALPTADDAILKIQVAFIGALEVDKKRLWFFASLFDSHVLFITIEGEFGLLIAWGDDANFVISVGGFHPSFSPPPLPFPSPRRIAVSLIDTDVARVRIEGYFAVTSNTVQFGAAVEIFFGFSAFNIKGHLAFDALFQFSPFHFIISISASFSLTAFGVGLLSVSVSGSLAGPAPWEAKGTGSVSILFFTISADFDVTWGDSDTSTLPPIAVMPMFKAEIEKPANWRALPPPSNNLLVSLRPLPDTDSLVLHPIGALHVSQRALPLDLTLDKVGNQKPSDVNRLSIDVTGGGLVKRNNAQEQFAPAQFQNFSDSDKLSRPAYAPEDSGLDLTAAGGDALTSKMVKRIVRYEQIILDTNAKRALAKFVHFAAGLFAHFLGGSAVTKSDLSQARKKKLDPFEEKVEVRSEGYTVAFQANNQAFSAEAASFKSEASAREFLARQAAADPNLGETLHVIPSFERAA